MIRILTILAVLFFLFDHPGSDDIDLLGPGGST